MTGINKKTDQINLIQPGKYDKLLLTKKLAFSWVYAGLFSGCEKI